MTAASAPAAGRARVAAIDVVRGLAVVLMALDHTRDYTTALRFQPDLLLMDLHMPVMGGTEVQTRLVVAGLLAAFRSTSSPRWPHASRTRRPAW